MALWSPWQVAALLVLAPVTEEIVFRLGLHQALLERLTAKQGVNLAVACVFAAAHALVRQSWSGLAVVGPALLIGLVYERSRKLMPCVLLHAAMNAGWMVWSAHINGQAT